MKVFTRRTMLGLLAFSLLAWTAAAATDVSGTWKGAYTDPAGRSFPITFNLRENAGAVTGTVIGIGPPPPATISNGNVAGDEISFDASGKDAYGREFTLGFSGKISGNDIRGAFNVPKAKFTVSVTKE